MVKLIGLALLFVVIAGALVVALLPRFLDRIYYRGPVSAHFDGQRFFNPDGDADTQGTPGGKGPASFFWNQLTGRDGRPAWPKSVPVTPNKPAPRVAGERMVVTWIGHATVLVQTNGLNILTDPVWSDNAGPFGLGPKRVTRPGIAFDDLPKIDLVLVSHNHYDHLDKATLKRLWDRDQPLIATSLGNDSVIGQTGAMVLTGLDWGQSWGIGSDGKPFVVGQASDTFCAERPDCRAEVIITRAHHWGSRWGSDRNRALWSGFVVRLPSGGNLYFAGDSGFGDGKWPEEAAALGPIRLALIPIGAFRFVPGQMRSGSHIGPADAVEVYRRTGAARAIPIHWGTFRLSYEGYDTPPRMLAKAMRCTNQRGFDPVEIGRPVEIAPYAPPRPAAASSRAAILACLDTPAVRAMR